MPPGIAKICDPDLYDLDEAIELAKSAGAAPDFEIALVRFLQIQCQSDHVPLPTVFRGLEVLGGMMDGRALDESRLLILFRPFLRSKDPRIVSKCVLVLGRQSNYMSWVNGVMDEKNGRIRANLIEALWKRREPEIEVVLRGALTDPHPRVAANAVYGLYLLGIEGWVEGLERLLGSDIAAFRISGIWVLKSSNLSDSPARIRSFIRDADPGVRHAAFHAIKHLRDHESKENAA
jgi:hypothetical protein